MKNAYVRTQPSNMTIARKVSCDISNILKSFINIPANQLLGKHLNGLNLDVIPMAGGKYKRVSTQFRIGRMNFDVTG